MCNEKLSLEMAALGEALDQAAQAYRNVAETEMNKGYGSIDKIYDCVRNSRNLANKSRRLSLYNSVY